MNQSSPAAGPSVKRPRVSVGIVVWRGDEVLLIKRGRAPYKAMWSIPGGSVELGERLQAAALRELSEETGVHAEIVGLIDVFESITDEGHYVMIDYAARWTHGEPVAGDDAAQAQFTSMAAAMELLSWDTLRDVLHRSAALVQASNSRRDDSVSGEP